MALTLFAAIHIPTLSQNLLQLLDDALLFRFLFPHHFYIILNGIVLTLIQIRLRYIFRQHRQILDQLLLRHQFHGIMVVDQIAHLFLKGISYRWLSLHPII